MKVNFTDREISHLSETIRNDCRQLKKTTRSSPDPLAYYESRRKLRVLKTIIKN